MGEINDQPLQLARSESNEPLANGKLLLIVKLHVGFYELITVSSYKIAAFYQIIQMYVH